ncbi:MAG TPA: ethylbenzene dehydrogenase-related protein [Chitinophagaceae bacterium]|nr:ethylbenzene dehydrogenase-related protein [Chitinophagaceae bacterium]
MKKYIIVALLVSSLTLFMYCTKNDQVVTAPVTSTNELLSYKTTTAPAIDGVADAVWGNAVKLNITPTVPYPGNNLFTGYNGEQYPATLQSMYDDQYVYFLAQWADATNSVNVSTWYFDPLTQRWAQEPTSRQFDVNGNMTRDGHGEDKLAMLWNIDFSTPNFVTQTCYASCHVFTPYTDFSVTPAVEKSNAGNGNHYTNGASEKIDMWWAHLSRDVIFNQMDDDYQDWAGGPQVTNLVGGSGNGRHVDGITVSGSSAKWPYSPVYTVTDPQGATNNRQTLKLDGTGDNVTVPAWIIPGASNYYYILATDTLAGGKAVKITGVSSTGVLSWDGGSLDPNADANYQRSGDAVYGGDGVKCFPSYIASPLIGSRADITCSAVYTGTGWIVEYKRKLKTGDVLKQDVDFSSLQDQQFGVAIWNQSNNQHGIAPNLVLKFQK